MMISVPEARKIIQQHVTALQPVQMKLQDAAGYRLAVDIVSPLDIPAYPQSSMDGYAFSFSDWQQNPELLVQGEMAAGSRSQLEIQPETAVRIFTGAPVPYGADTVVMQEKTSVTNHHLQIHDEQLKQGANVRLQGSEIKKGELALTANATLTPAAMGFLAGMGITDVMVFPPPAVTIIITGNELQNPGQPLAYGQVYDSNSFALTAALQQNGIRQIKVVTVPDVLDQLTDALQQALELSDLVLLTGGVSVGDYDFVLEAATRCGITTRFHKIKQRPGKPLFFGTEASKLVFGLPGNPSSVLTCFYMYVLPAIIAMSGKQYGLLEKQAPLSKSYRKAAGLTHFLKGYYDGNTVLPLGAQESYRMRSFAAANCLIEIEEQVTDCIEGTMVNIHLLPVE
jgi:molybdopterin molybdotransferase